MNHSDLLTLQETLRDRIRKEADRQRVLGDIDSKIRRATTLNPDALEEIDKELRQKYEKRIAKEQEFPHLIARQKLELQSLLDKMRHRTDLLRRWKDSL